MKAVRWTVLVGVLVVLAARSEAAEFRSSTLGSVSSVCSGGCVDTWLVQCTSPKTHRIAARVGNNFPGGDLIEAIIVGFSGPAVLVGQADRVLAPTVTSEPAVLERPGSTLGAMKALVEVAQIAEEDPKHPPNGGYFVEFSCEDPFGDDLDAGVGGSGRPIVKQLQDE